MLLFNASCNTDISHSVLLAVLAVLAVSGHLPQLNSIGAFTILLIV